MLKGVGWDEGGGVRSKGLETPRDQFLNASRLEASVGPSLELSSGRLQSGTLEMLPPLEAFAHSVLHVSCGPAQSLASDGWNPLVGF